MIFLVLKLLLFSCVIQVMTRCKVDASSIEESKEFMNGKVIRLAIVHVSSFQVDFVDLFFL